MARFAAFLWLIIGLGVAVYAFIKITIFAGVIVALSAGAGALIIYNRLNK